MIYWKESEENKSAGAVPSVKPARGMTQNADSKPAEVPNRAFIDCLKQQTTDYYSEDPFLVAMDKDNRLYLITYFDGSFNLYRVACENGKVNIVFNYRKTLKNFYKDFQYQKSQGAVKIHLEAKEETADFEVRDKWDVTTEHFSFVREQQKEFEAFTSRLEIYFENIHRVWADQKKELSNSELIDRLSKIPEEKRMEIADLAEEGNAEGAIRVCRRATGLGLADSRRIVDQELYRYVF